MKPILCIAVAAAVVSFAAKLSFPEEPQPDQKPSFWMEKKLEYSQKILIGLANQDFAQIGKTARSLNALNQMEKWVRSGVPEYRAQLQIFQNANQQLIKTADNENLDGAALAYVQMTMSCVNCHKVMRSSHPAAPNPPK